MWRPHSVDRDWIEYLELQAFNNAKMYLLKCSSLLFRQSSYFVVKLLLINSNWFA